MEVISNNDIMLNCMSALHGHVPPLLRAVSVEQIKNDLHWKCEFDAGATEDDFELLSDAAGEALAHFPSLGLEEIIIINSFPNKISPLKNLIYFRHEHNYYRE